jgi:transglutaminase-like putative cysteine protease
VTGIVLVARERRQRLEGLGRQLNPGTPVVSTTQAGGMVLQHRRSKHMPIEERVANLQKLVWESVQDPRMIKLARELTLNVPERDGKAEAEAIYKAVKARIRYGGDIAPVKMPDGKVEPIDLYLSAWRVWEMRNADCDEHSVLIATLLSLNGITAKFRVTAPSKSSDWTHIYTVALLPKFSPKNAVALDTTLPGNNRFNYEVPFAKKIDFDV